jgi:hypothetical protein
MHSGKCPAKPAGGLPRRLVGRAPGPRYQIRHHGRGRPRSIGTLP